MQDYPRWPNLATMLFSCARLWGERTLFRYHRDGAWHTLSWTAFADQAASLARGLRAAGVSAGDRVLVTSPNRPEIAIAELALMAIRAVPVPAYVTNTAADHAHLLRDAGIRVAIAADATLGRQVAASVDCDAAGSAGGLDHMILFDGSAPEKGLPPLLDWAALTGDGRGAADIAAEAAEIKPGAMACLIYTSGTGGAPKGVMLPHRAMLANCRSIWEIVKPLGIGGETYLSFLPLSHAFEHTVGLLFFPSIGLEIVFARGAEHLAADLATASPAVVTVVPRVLEVIRSRVLAQTKRAGPLSRALFALTLAAGLRRIDGTATVADRLLDPLLDRLVRRRVRARFGGRLRAAVCGGARLDPAVGRFFIALGVPVMQGYGQTEAGPVVSVNPLHAIRAETVGPVLDGVDIRIAPDGEVLLRGELVMDGYWRQPEETARTVVDGWLHTGDVGQIDPDGYLRITDRKRDIIVLSGGETISPAKVEAVLTDQPAIAQAVIAGDGGSGLVALLVPAEGAEPGLDAAVKAANRGLAVHERIRRHAAVPAFTVENGLLTPTLKVRRTLVLRSHADQIHALLCPGG